MYLLRHKNGQFRVENDAATVVAALAKGDQWLAWELESDEDSYPVIGVQVTLGPARVVAEINEIELLRNGVPVGSGQTRVDAPVSVSDRE